MRRNAPPAVQRSKQAVHCRLQLWRVVAHVAGLPEHLINDGVERDDAPGELAALGFRVLKLRLCKGEHAAKSPYDLGCQICKCFSEPALGAAEISTGEDDAGARDPDAYLARARDRQKEDVRTRTSGRAEIIGGNDSRGIA